MRTKRLAAIFTALLTCASLIVTGCGGKQSASSGESDGGVYKDKIAIGCTTDLTESSISMDWMPFPPTDTGAFHRSNMEKRGQSFESRPRFSIFGIIVYFKRKKYKTE